jgi:hypothetical protein
MPNKAVECRCCNLVCHRIRAVLGWFAGDRHRHRPVRDWIVETEKQIRLHLRSINAQSPKTLKFKD